MDLKSEVAIISVFGRGHWLAASLARHKVPVSLLDVSAQMGEWTPEDVEGPFGFFQISDSEKERLESESPSVPVPQGFTLWLSDGPMEFHGPTTHHRLKQYEIPDSVLSYLQGRTRINALKGLRFQQTWPAHLAHSLTSSVDTLAAEAMKEGLKRNLLSSFSIRQMSADDHQRSLKWCEDLGVNVMRQVEIKDLSFEEKKLANLEIRTDKSGIFSASQFVLCLTAEECAMISPKLQTSVFPKGASEPEWVWLRYRLKIKGQGPLSHLTRDQIPLHCVVIDDLMLPWSHENLLILQRTFQKDEFDAWVKVPNNQRFHSQYLVEQGRKIKDLLESRVSDNEVTILSLPAEAESTLQKVGPARHPVYSRSLRTLRNSYVLGNIYLDSPEFWPALSWEGQFAHQIQIIEALRKYWDRKEELRIKREAKEAAKRKKQGKDTGAEL